MVKLTIDLIGNKAQFAGMHFSHLMHNIPRPFSADHGHEARQFFAADGEEIQDFVAAVAGSSPYLKGLIEKEHQWLRGAFAQPDAALKVEFSNLKATAGSDLMSALRRAKRRVALWTALCDLAGVWALEEVTEALSKFADLACQISLNHALKVQLQRGKIPMRKPETDPAGLGMFVLAMGKLGANELNYSSDIDLICFFDESYFASVDVFEARAGFIRATKNMVALLNDITAEGYVFRTDLRLRPDPSVTPVCMGVEAAEHYYESRGRTWERSAFIKARVIAGDLKAGARFLQKMEPFVWRKYLDFAAIEDAHNIRLQIRRKTDVMGAITLPKHNIKLGRGGIREIEFFTQTRQLIAGGRDPDLRLRGTQQSLAALCQKGWIDPLTKEQLTEHYQAHRVLEHRLQMINDAQTHSLPASEVEFERLAALMSRSADALKSEIFARLTSVHQITEDFFGPASSDVPIEAPEFSEILDKWPTYPALRSERAYTIFMRLQPEILKRLKQTDKTKEAVLAFDRFLSGLPTGVQLFSLFEANPQLIDLLVDIVGTSDHLAEYLARNAQVFDAVIGGSFWDAWPGSETLTQDLSKLLQTTEDYETKLDMTRRWVKEWHFRIGVHLLRDLTSVEQTAQEYADLAEAALAALWPEICAEFSRKYGPPPGRGAALIAMGSLGAQRLHSNSDLDVILLYDDAGQEASIGPKSLQSRSYYARLTQSVITALTAPMAEGRLYNVDMRLRPSGNQGPVATSWPAFKAYQQKQAWVWEHLALTQARPVTGCDSLCSDFEAFRLATLRQADPDKCLRGLSKMRARLLSAWADKSSWHFKRGRGRLLDIELLSHLGLLLEASMQRDTQSGLTNLQRLGIVNAADLVRLIAAYKFLFPCRLVSKFLSDDILNPTAMGSRDSALLFRVSGTKDFEDLQSQIKHHRQVVDEILTQVLPVLQESDHER